MGDAADMAIDQGMAEEEYRFDHPEEFEDENCDVGPTRPRTIYTKYKVCRNCGKGGFHWQKSKQSGGWRLFDNYGKIHNCSKKFSKGGKRIVYKEKKKLIKPKHNYTFESSGGATYGDGDYIGIDY